MLSFYRKISLLFVFVLFLGDLFGQNLYLINKDGYWGAINDSLKIVVPLKYRKCEIINNKYIVVYQQNRMGLYNALGEFILPVAQNSIINKYRDIFIVNRGTMVYLYNAKTKNIISSGRDVFFRSIKLGIISYKAGNSLYIVDLTTDEKYMYDLDSISTLQQFRPTSYNNTMADYFQNNKEYDFSYYFIYKNGLKGIMSEDFNIIIEPQFKDIYYTPEYFFTDDEHENGVFDADGNEIIAPEFDDVSLLLNNAFLVTKSGKSGIFDVQGKNIIPIKHISISYVNGCYVVVNEDDRCGLINANGKVIIAPRYDDIDDLGDDYFSIISKGKYGVIFKTGKIIYQPTFENVEVLNPKAFKIYDNDFCGIASVDGKIILSPKYNNTHKTSNPNVFLIRSSVQDAISHADVCKRFGISKKIRKDVTEQNRFGLVNIDGEMLLDTLYYIYQINISPNYVVVDVDSSMKLVFSLDDDGKLIDKMKVRYFSAIDASDRIILDNYWKKKTLPVTSSNLGWGLFAPNGSTLIDYKFDSKFENIFTDTAIVITELDYELYGLVDDVVGYEIFKPIFTAILLNDFDSANVARCVLKSGLSTLIYATGKPVNKFGFAYVDDFFNGTTRVCHGAKFVKHTMKHFELNVNGTYNDAHCLAQSGRWSIIDKNGNYIAEKKYGFIQKQFRDEYIVMTKNKKWGIVDCNDSLKFDFVYDGLEYFANDTEKWYDIEYLKAKKGRKWGVVDTFNNHIVDYKYDDIKFLKNRDGLFWGVKGNQKWGLINSLGDTIIPLEYDDITYLFDSTVALFKVEINGLYKGYFNSDFTNNSIGKFTDAKPFVNNFARVKIKKGWSFINDRYEVISTEKYTQCRDFQEGMAAVRTSKGWGFIDTFGSTIVTPQYSLVKDFSSGVASFKQGRKMGFIDKNNQIVFKPKKYRTVSPFLGDVALVKRRKKYAILNQNTKKRTSFKYKNFTSYPQYDIFVLSDNKRRKIILKSDGSTPFDFKKYKNIGEFYDGMAQVTTFDGKIGFIDTAGIERIKPIYDRVADFSNGFAAVSINNKWGYVNHDTLIIPVNFKKAYPFNLQEFAKVKNSDNQVLYIDSLGNYCNQNYVKNMYENDYHCGITFSRNGSYYNFLDTSYTQKYVMCLVDKAFDFKYNLGVIKARGKYGIIDTSGFFVIPPMLKNISEFQDNHAIFQVKEQFGVFSVTGEEVVPPKAFDIKLINSNMIQVQYYNQTIYIDNSGNVKWQ